MLPFHPPAALPSIPAPQQLTWFGNRLVVGGGWWWSTARGIVAVLLAYFALEIPEGALIPGH